MLFGTIFALLTFLNCAVFCSLDGIKRVINMQRSIQYSVSGAIKEGCLFALLQLSQSFLAGFISIITSQIKLSGFQNDSE